MKTFAVALRLLLVLSCLTGLVYPALITVAGEVAFTGKAHGSLVKNPDGKVIGSEWIAQKFQDPRYFFPRPSAVDYNSLSSGGSNLGPSSQALSDQITERQKAGAQDDLLSASGSGLDPHISRKTAMGQVERVASARGMPAEQVRSIVESLIEKRQFRVLGEERVNVLLLNLALDERQKP